MTYGILGRAAIAAGITAVLAGSARAQGAGKAVPRLVVTDSRALIVFPPATAARPQPTLMPVPKTQPRTVPGPATSVRRAPWPDRKAMFAKAGVLLMAEDSSNSFDLDGNRWIGPKGALWTSSGHLRIDGWAEPGTAITVGVTGQYAREHPTLQLHFYVKNESLYAWTVHSLVDGSDVDAPAKPKVPAEIVVLVNVPPDFIADDKLNTVYGLVNLALKFPGPWWFDRVAVFPITTKVIGPGT